MLKEYFRKHGLFFYFLLTIVITWGGIYMAVGLDGILGNEAIPDNRMPILYSVTLLGPIVSSLIMTALADGKAGFRNIGSRLFKWRNNIGWYALALLTVPLMVTGLLLILSRFSIKFTPAILLEKNKGSLLALGIFMGLAVGFFEEVGWTGFALPKLRERYSVLKSGLLLGIFWGLWHLPLFVASTKTSGSVSPIIYLVVLLFSFLPIYRVIMTWVYERTESLLIAILMHAPLSASQLILIPPELSGTKLVVYNLIFSVLLWVMLGFLLVNEKQNQKIFK